MGLNRRNLFKCIPSRRREISAILFRQFMEIPASLVFADDKTFFLGIKLSPLAENRIIVANHLSLVHHLVFVSANVPGIQA